VLPRHAQPPGTDEEGKRQSNPSVQTLELMLN
jgi:hypothetical protein